MPLDVQTQRLVLAICGIVTVAILAIDWALWRWIGSHATISCACQYMFERLPVSYTLLMIWIGVLVGHLLPVK